MNYLAHALLSGQDDDLLCGNFIGDFVKGKQWMILPHRIGQGVVLHRFIDDFTDQHPLSAEGREVLRASCGKYAGVALDVIYDHILAANWERYHPQQPLRAFTEDVYLRLDACAHQMPERAERTLEAMRLNNWLYGYRDLHGLQSALSGLQRRTSRPYVFDGLIRDAIPVISRIEPLFHRFFPEIGRSCSSKIHSFADD